MSNRQIQMRAYKEWQCSSDIKCRYHTFDYYWFERYVRVYGLPARVPGADRREH